MAAIVPGERLVIFYPVWIFFSQMKMQRVHPRKVLPTTALLIEPYLKNNNLWCSSFVGLTFARWNKHVKMFICMWLSDVSHCKKLVSEGNRNHSFKMLCCVLCTTKSVSRIPSNDEPYFFLELQNMVFNTSLNLSRYCGHSYIAIMTLLWNAKTRWNAKLLLMQS